MLGTIGNDAHLETNFPEDHTPFSFTAWPVSLTGPDVTAIDLGNVRGLGDAIERGAREGRYPWLKYLNHSGVQVDVRNDWEREPNADYHVHISIRSDWVDRSIGEFDPWGEEVEPSDFWEYEFGSPALKLEPRAAADWMKDAYKARRDILAELKAMETRLAKGSSVAPTIDYEKLAAELIRQLSA